MPTELLTDDELATVRKLPAFAECEHIACPRRWLHIVLDFGLDCCALTQRTGATVHVSQVYISTDDGGLEITASVGGSHKVDQELLFAMTSAWERSMSTRV